MKTKPRNDYVIQDYADDTKFGKELVKRIGKDEHIVSVSVSSHTRNILKDLNNIGYEKYIKDVIGRMVTETAISLMSDAGEEEQKEFLDYFEELEKKDQESNNKGIHWKNNNDK